MTDEYFIGQQNQILRTNLFSLFRSGNQITEYEGVVLDFEQKKYPGVWGPSIDTLLFTRAFERIGIPQSKKVLEVGTGSGFISKYILSKNSDLESMTMIDLNEYASACARQNISDNRASFFTGDAKEFMEGKNYDLIICNPPYVPRPKSIDDNPYEGLVLLHYLISEAKNNLNEGGSLITNFSSLSSDMAYDFCNSAGCNVEIMDQMEVSLKIGAVLNQPEWKNYLTETGRLRVDNKRGYDYWHTINIVKVTPK